MNVRRRLFPWFALVLIAALLSGCGPAPNAPAVAPGGDAPSGSQVAKPAAEADGLLGGLVDGVFRLVFRTLDLVGSLGGSLTNGRWRVDIPAGAVEGTATVSLGVSSSTSLECQLEIDPPSKNGFAVPVTLTADCPGVPDSELRNYVVFWYDPAARRWVPVEGSRVDLAAGTVSAPLEHFSTYKVGSKASW